MNARNGIELTHFGTLRTFRHILQFNSSLLAFIIKVSAVAFDELPKLSRVKNQF